MTEASDTEATPAEPHRGPSAVLVEARGKLQLSQKEVADKLLLTKTFIKYIDAGEFDRLPKPAFIRGYLRSYARVVELSGDFIVELYEKELQLSEPTTEIKDITDEKVGTAHITGPVMRTGVIGLGLLFLVIGLILWLVTDDEPESAVRVAEPFVTGPELQQEDSPAFEDVIEPVPATASEQEIAENVGPDESTETQFDETQPSEGSASELQVEQESETASEPSFIASVSRFGEATEPESR